MRSVYLVYPFDEKKKKKQKRKRVLISVSRRYTFYFHFHFISSRGDSRIPVCSANKYVVKNIDGGTQKENNEKKRGRPPRTQPPLGRFVSNILSRSSLLVRER